MAPLFCFFKKKASQHKGRKGRKSRKGRKGGGFRSINTCVLASLREDKEKHTWGALGALMGVRVVVGVCARKRIALDSSAGKPS